MNGKPHSFALKTEQKTKNWTRHGKKKNRRLFLSKIHFLLISWHWKRSPYPAPSPMEPQENWEDQVACCARHVASAGQTSSQDRVFPSAKVRSPWWWVVSAICQNLLRFFPTTRRCRDLFSNSFRFYCRAGLKWYCWCTKIPAQKTLLKYTAFRQFEIKYEAFFGENTTSFCKSQVPSPPDQQESTSTTRPQTDHFPMTAKHRGGLSGGTPGERIDFRCGKRWGARKVTAMSVTWWKLTRFEDIT